MDWAYQRILIGTDFSERSLQAALAAVRLATPGKTELILCHALGVRSHFAYSATVPEDGSESDSMTHHKRIADEELQVFLATIGAPDYNFQTMVLDRSADRGIPRLARQLDCDLIVIGACGVSGPRRFSLGSVAERIIRNSSTPILVIPTPAPTPNPPARK